MKKSIAKAYFLVFPPSALSLKQLERVGETKENLVAAYKLATDKFKKNTNLMDIDGDEIPIFLDPELSAHIHIGDLISLDCDLEGKHCSVGYNFIPKDYVVHQVGSPTHQVVMWNTGFGGDELQFKVIDRNVLFHPNSITIQFVSVFV